ncbi:MAG: SH3 domain-containing protein [Chloroflexota bacterium]|nr:SH3 domain-containing protein [Chloroflexota bacterium]
MPYLRSRLFQLILLVALFLLSASVIAAQGDTAVPLRLGENLPAELTAAAPVATFAFEVTAPQRVTVQVLALAQGMQPAFTIFDPSGIVVQSVSTQTSTIIASDVTFANVGTYLIEVTSSSGILGGFVISLQAAEGLAPAQPIVLGQVINDAVDATSPERAYRFQTLPAEDVFLTVDAPPGSFSGPVITLQDGVTNEMLALASPRLAGVRYRLPFGNAEYVVVISHSGAPVVEAFQLCVGPASGPSSCAPGGAGGGEVAQVPTAAPGITPTVFVPIAIPPTGPCAVTPASNGVINVRSAPTTSSAVIGRLQPNATASVLGRLPDSSWYLVNVSGLLGWVSGSVVVVGGQCGGVGIVTPTAGPTATAPATATPTATSAATATATSTATATPAPVATLNFSLPPIFGSTSLTSGFVPDPFTVGITAGGPANVSYLGGGCTGFTSTAPSFSVTYTSGAFPTLRFFFVGSADTTMIINAPNGSYFCSDDSFGTLHPTIDFNSPSSGRYDVWIGTFSSGGSVGGTLSVTESTGNRP